MTLVFVHHTHRYEVENIAKLFYATMLFEHVDDPETMPEEDYLATILERGEEETVLWCRVQDGEDFAQAMYTVSNADDSYDKHCEFYLCRAVYDALQQIHPTKLPWGVMTGIRPVKQYAYLLEKGASEEEARRIFLEENLVSPEKFELCQQIDRIQRPIIASSKPESYSLYLSIPFCPSRCSYCSFVSSSIAAPKAKALVGDYLEKLCEELFCIAKEAKDAHLKLETIYIGGGTPTTLTAPQLQKLLDTVAQAFPADQVREYTVEAGRADTITRKKLEVIRQSAANRISINPQSFDDGVLARIGRKHSAQDVVDCYEMATQMGFDGINMDFIAGLPGDTYETFCRTIDRAVELAPSNITVHTLTIKRSSDLFWKPEELEGQKQTSAMVDYANRTLTKAGYLPYYLYRQKNTVQNLENVGYCKPGYEGLYNIFIMEEIHTILAAGGGAVSKLIREKSQKVQRIFNYKYPYEYVRGFDEILRRKEQIGAFYRSFLEK